MQGFLFTKVYQHIDWHNIAEAIKRAQTPDLFLILKCVASAPVYFFLPQKCIKN